MRAFFAEILILLFFFYFSPQKTFAVTININNSPSSVAIGQEFNVSFSASDLEINNQYYGKIRIGTNNSYTKGETKNGDSWFGDTDSWVNFPTFNTDASGTINETLTGRAKNTIQLGTNQLFVRLRKVGGTTNVSPDGQTIIEITQATSTSTPSPTPSATPVPTSSRTTSPTSTTQSSSKLIASPIATKVGADFTKDIPTGADVLGSNSALATPKNTKDEVKTLGSSENNLSKIFLGAGFIIILVSLGFYFKNRWIKQS